MTYLFPVVLLFITHAGFAQITNIIPLIGIA
jgi:hypothetical protein